MSIAAGSVITELMAGSDNVNQGISGIRDLFFKLSDTSTGYSVIWILAVIFLKTYLNYFFLRITSHRARCWRRMFWKLIPSISSSSVSKCLCWVFHGADSEGRSSSRARLSIASVSCGKAILTHNKLYRAMPLGSLWPSSKYSVGSQRVKSSGTGTM